MTEEITAEQVKAFYDHQMQMLAQIQEQASYDHQLKIEKQRLVVFRMAGAFANEVHLCHESNGLWYNVRIT